ncbi:hypothetical protein Salat_1956700 [Sesamum alatum]|uniref:Uncharacterized protein n=1 Tax=Sesamum alatum TaxID=300844 RepID=A0AAE2CIT5_9LAMI|nr:hypothetical protein Salat_1956700 [Sesamum alatum]
MEHRNRRVITISDLYILFVLLTVKAYFRRPYPPNDTMVRYIHRALTLFICVGLLALQPNEVSGLRSSDLALRQGRGDQPVMVMSHRVLLNAVGVNNLNSDKKPAPVNKKFDSNQSSKRKVRRGSDPIHNRT